MSGKIKAAQVGQIMNVNVGDLDGMLGRANSLSARARGDDLSHDAADDIRALVGEVMRLAKLFEEAADELRSWTIGELRWDCEHDATIAELRAEVERLEAALASSHRPGCDEALAEVQGERDRAEALVSELTALFPELSDPDSPDYQSPLVDAVRDAAQTQRDYDRALKQWGSECAALARQCGLPRLKTDGQGRQYYESVLGSLRDVGALVAELAGVVRDALLLYGNTAVRSEPSDIRWRGRVAAVLARCKP